MDDKQISSGDKVYMETDMGSEPVTIIRTPAGEGDLWHIKGYNGEIRAINPYHRSFKGFIKNEK